ncbi:spore coat protein [Paenibacillus swuensis]|uniref:Glucose-1-phosphate thymidylyltransferase n=1 Tax=Paenibacillus swuensis TaxID=1178515 RepID=A0A172TP33_9BACL|nr:sugar phosphate nucleotidyltransferase [Paenibacillus swuensis]ANE48780.1 spore coat protein [Paenibacillus swuensis]
MKGIILAGGTGTRLRPLTNMINKHLLPVGRYPMIYYAVDKLKEAGITEIMLITGKFSAGLYVDFLGSGEAYGVNLTYRIQEKAGGIAEALSLAQGFIDEHEKFVVILGDNLFEDSLGSYVEQFKAQESGAMVLLKKVHDPKRYGVPVFNAEGHITAIEEKPSEPKSDYSVTGIYMYDSRVFAIIGDIEPSARGELEITDVNNVYTREGKLAWNILQGWWTDAGTFESLDEAAKLIRAEQEK